MIRNKMGMLLLVCFASAMLVSCQKDKQNQKVDSDDNVDPLAMESELAILALDGRIESGKGSAAFDWVTPFETATGCKVKAVQLNGNDLFASTLAGKQFDLVIVADSFLSSDVFQKIDFSRIRAFKNLDARFSNITTVQNQFGLPLHWKLLKPVPPSTESIVELENTHLVANAKNPNCAYAWMEWSLSPKVQGDIAAALDTIPVVPAACAGNELLGDEACQLRATETPVEVTQAK